MTLLLALEVAFPNTPVTATPSCTEETILQKPARSVQLAGAVLAWCSCFSLALVLCGSAPVFLDTISYLMAIVDHMALFNTYCLRLLCATCRCFVLLHSFPLQWLALRKPAGISVVRAALLAVFVNYYCIYIMISLGGEWSWSGGCCSC